MISTESFSKEWIVRRSEELGYNNKQLLEKVIRAFALLEMLVDAGAPIVFKGGSSLLLILKDTLNRLRLCNNWLVGRVLKTKSRLFARQSYRNRVASFAALSTASGEFQSPNKSLAMLSGLI